MNLEVDVYRRLGAFTLDVRFTTDGGLTALFGRSGSGKTSLINIISGLLRPDRGRVAVDGKVLVDTARGVFVPAHRRRLGYIFQEPRLFPHLNRFGRTSSTATGSRRQTAAASGSSELLNCLALATC